MSGSPTSPIRAHHRLLRSIAQTHFAGTDPTPFELDRVAAVFARAGGSWQGCFEGSAEDLNLLKKILKVAVAKGLVSKADDWSR